jgi:hypothetical protein
VPSVADSLREATRAELAAMTPTERVALARALGERDLEVYRLASGLPLDVACRRLERSRQLGRRRSACAEGRGGG